jgi:2-iminobutanoate/2-iminopropanoate deaminase
VGVIIVSETLQKQSDMKKTIATNGAPAAIGPYSQAVELNGTVFVSGQLPVNPVTGEIPQGIEAQTRRALENIGAILEAAGLTYNDVVKTTVLLADMADFAAMNAVYAEFFTQDKPARVCFQAAALPKNALVEIDAVAGK